MDVDQLAERRRAPKRSRRVLLADPAPDVPASDAKKLRDDAPDFSPPVETPSAPARAPGVARAPDELVVICCASSGDSSALNALTSSARARAIHALVGDVDEVRRLRSGALVFVCKSADQVRSLLAIDSFCDVPVIMRPPKPRSTCVYGVITGVATDIDVSSLRSALLAVGATEYMRLQRRVSPTELVDTRSIRVAFPAALPAFVVIDYERLPVRPFIHRPLQCFNCQRYGHGASFCRSKPRCGRCSGPHSSRACTGDADRCAMCGGTHAAWSRECAHNARARQVESVRAQEGLSYAAAVRRVPPVAAPVRPPVVTVNASTQTTCRPAPRSTVSTNTTADLAPTRLPKESRLLAHSDDPDGPQMLLFHEDDIARFLRICLRFLRSPLQDVDIDDAIEDAIAEFFHLSD